MRRKIVQAGVAGVLLVAALTAALAEPVKKQPLAPPRVEVKAEHGSEADVFADSVIIEAADARDAVTQRLVAAASGAGPPLDPQTRVNLERERRQYQAAIDRRVADNPGDLRVQNGGALDALHRGDLKTASALADRAVALGQASGDPKAESAVRKTSALAYAVLGDQTRAHADAARAVALDPEDAIARDIEKLTREKNLPSRVRLIADEKEPPLPPEIVSLLERVRSAAVVNRPAGFASSVGYTQRADTGVKLGDYDRMYQEATLALQKLPDNPRAYMQRAFASLMLKNYDDAIVDASAGLRLKPNAASLLGLRATAYNETNKPKKALEDAQKAIDADPKDPVAWLQKGLAREKLGAPPEQYLADIKNAADFDPEFGRFFTEALARRDQRASASTQGGGAATIEQTSAASWRRVAWTLMQLLPENPTPGQQAVAAAAGVGSALAIIGLVWFLKALFRRREDNEQRNHRLN